MNYAIVSTYLEYCETHKRLSKHTIRAYKNDLRQFYSSSHNTVESYISYLTKTNIKTSTLRRKIACLKVYYNYLMAKDLVKENPFNQMRFQFRAEKTLPKTIPCEDLRAIFLSLKEKSLNAKTPYQQHKAERNLLIICILLSTGIRISELCNIKLQDINLSNRTLHITGKGKKERIIFLGDQTTFLLLKAYISTYCDQSASFLFTGSCSSCKPLSTQSVRLFLRTLQEQNQLNRTITPHMFRHSFATMLLDKDVDIRYIQQILGHSSISVTQIYTHVSQSKQREILTFHNPITSVLP